MSQATRPFSEPSPGIPDGSVPTAARITSVSRSVQSITLDDEQELPEHRQVILMSKHTQTVNQENELSKEVQQLQQKLLHNQQIIQEGEDAVKCLETALQNANLEIRNLTATIAEHARADSKLPQEIADLKQQMLDYVQAELLKLHKEKYQQEMPWNEHDEPYEPTPSLFNCTGCGTVCEHLNKHRRCNNNCPARYYLCQLCGKMGHYEQECNSCSWRP